jgi:hypothetical protein
MDSGDPQSTMLHFFSPGAENCEARESMYQDFLKIREQAEDPYRYKYMSGPPETVPYADALAAEKTLTMDHVADWVDKWEHHPGLCKWESLGVATSAASRW